MISLHDFVYGSGITAIAAVTSAAVVTTALFSPIAAGLFVLSGVTYAIRKITKAD